MPILSRGLIPVLVIAAFSTREGSAADHSISVALDPARTHIEWTLGGNVHEVHGTFRLRSGTLTYDTNSGTAKGEFVADATSGESGNGSRDKRMRSSILETERFPEIRFVPESFSTPTGSPTEFKTTILGSFTLHGATHPLSVPMAVKVTANELTASGSFVIPYVEWGLKDPSTFIFRVNKEVQLHVTTAGRIAKSFAK